MKGAVIIGLLGAIISCKGKVHDLGPVAEPLATIHGRLVGGRPNNVVRLRAGLLWAGVPVYIPYCQRYGPGGNTVAKTLVARHGCRDPFGVVPAIAGPSVALDPEATSFELPIYQIPDPSVMIGRPPARVAYASLILYEDLNGDGELSLIRSCYPPDRDSGVDGEDAAAPDPEPIEPILASTFTTLRAPQVRIAYVEGRFDRSSQYYPSRGCGLELPPGFSVLSVGGYFDPPSCEIAPIDRPIELEPSGVDFRLLCTESPEDALPSPPPAETLPTDFLSECSAEGELVALPPGCTCPHLQIYSLSGCYNDLNCPNPDWTEPAPSSWPCGQRDGGL